MALEIRGMKMYLDDHKSIQEIIKRLELDIDNNKSHIEISEKTYDGTSDSDMLVFNILYSVDEFMNYKQLEKHFRVQAELESNTPINDDDPFGSENDNEFLVINFPFNLDEIQVAQKYSKIIVDLNKIIFLCDFKQEFFHKKSYPKLNESEIIHVYQSNINSNDCTYVKTVDIRRTDNFNSSMDIFLEDIIFYNLSGKFEANGSRFKNILMENYEFVEIDIFDCNGNDFVVMPVQKDLIMKSISIDYSEFRSITANSQENEIDIDIKKFNVSNSKLGILSINDARVDIFTIKKSFITELTMNNTIIDIDFLLKRTGIKRMDFSRSYFRGRVFIEDDLFGDMKINEIVKKSENSKANIENIKAIKRLIYKTENKELELKFLHYYYQTTNSYRKVGITKIINYIIDISTGYFTSYKKILISMLLSIFIFSCFYFLFYNSLDLNYHLINDSGIMAYLNCLYFSIISFTTIGYGDVSPTGILRFFSGVQGIFGILLTASFITVLARRFS